MAERPLASTFGKALVARFDRFASLRSRILNTSVEPLCVYVAATTENWPPAKAVLEKLRAVQGKARSSEPARRKKASPRCVTPCKRCPTQLRSASTQLSSSTPAIRSCASSRSMIKRWRPSRFSTASVRRRRSSSRSLRSLRVIARFQDGLALGFECFVEACLRVRAPVDAQLIDEDRRKRIAAAPVP